MRLPLLTSSLCLLPLLFSCKNKDHKNAEGHKDQKYQAALHLPAGAKYYFNINTETESKVSLPSKDIESTNESDVGLIYEVVRSTTDNIQIKITYDQLHISFKNKKGEKESTAGMVGQAMERLEKLLGAVKGESMTVTVNAKGDILQVAGGDAIKEKLMATLNDQDKNIQTQTRQVLNRFVGDEFVKSNMTRQFQLFPDTAVSVGDSWKLPTILPTDIEAEAMSTCKLESMNDNVAKVETVSEINTNQNTKVMGGDVTASSKGFQEGHYETDTTTGLLMNGESTMTIEGNFQLMGKELPLYIKMTKHIKGKKL